MRPVSGVILLAAIAISLPDFSGAQACRRTASAEAQAPSGDHTSVPIAGAAQPPAKPKPAGNPPPKTVKKYLLEIYTLPKFCVPFSTNPEQAPSSQPSRQAQRSASGVFFCDSGFLLRSSNNAADIASSLASADDDFDFKPVAPDKIAVYLKAEKPPDPHHPPSRLADMRAAIGELATPDLRYAEVMQLPARTAARVAAAVKDLSPAGITASALGSDRILLQSKDDPDPALLSDLHFRIGEFAWHSSSVPPTQRLFELDPGKDLKSLGLDSGSDASPKSAGGGSSSGGNPSAGSPASSSKPASAAASAPATAANSTDKKSTDNQSSSSSSPASDASANKPESGIAGGKSDHPAGKPAPASPSMRAVKDTLIFANDDGSDDGIFERNRLMAVLDLPRPEVLLNMWSLQASSRNPRITNEEAEAARELVAQHNEALGNAIEYGWDHLSRSMKNQGFFDRQFYEYITQKFAFAGQGAIPGGEQREPWGWCQKDTYCLGFTHAFEPLRPTLTNILLAIIAADDAATVSRETIQKMDDTCIDDNGDEIVACTSAEPTVHEDAECPERGGQTATRRDDKARTKKTCPEKGRVDKFEACMDRQLRDLATLRREAAEDDCDLDDRLTMIDQIVNHRKERPQFACFSKQARQSFGPAKDHEEQYAGTRVGLLRSAIADFLFNYKWSVQYPHDFVPYDLTQSAQELNAEFNPLVLAFNRDVAAFTQNLQTELQCKQEVSRTVHDKLDWLHGGDETFLNDAMIAVRGISGVESIVDTVTQSFFNATRPPSLTDLVKSVSDAETNVPGVLKTNLSANEAAVLLGALNSVTPAEAKIGRQLTVDITPHALAGASSAELDVKLTAEEQGNPTYFTADKSTEDNLSRVAKHNTTTKVRVESLKLFEVSAFSAMLQRPRSKFPLLPPFFEVPYFGTFIGIPIQGAKVYHRSTAIVSAVIVPTAADLAFGIDFGADRICAPAEPGSSPCHAAHSPADFGALPLRTYHKAIVQCFASHKNTAYPGNLFRMQERSIPGDACDRGKLSFHAVPPPE